MTTATLDLTLENPETIAILLRFPEFERNIVAEKYIIIGDTVARYAQLVTSQESIERYFDPVSARIGSLVADAESALSRLESRIPESLKASTQETVTQLQRAQKALDDLHTQYSTLLGVGVASTVKAALADASRDMTGAVESLKEQRDLLAKLVPSVAKAAKKGALSCEAVHSSLQQAFRDDRFEDVSAHARSTDMVGIPGYCGQPIYIEVKDYSNPVPSEEVVKFWRDLDARKAQVGVFLSLRTRIVGVTSDFCIQADGSRMGVFGVSDRMGDQGHILGYAVARKMLEIVLGTGKAVATERYEWMSRVLNNRLLDFKAKLSDLEKVLTEVESLRCSVDRQMSAISRQISDLRGGLHAIVDVTLKDFVEANAVPELTNDRNRQTL